MDADTVAIIVLYNADKNILRNVLERLCVQVGTCILVKNDDTDISEIINNFINVRLIDLCSNKGIAYAQNIGVNIAKDLGAKYILFSDQDTVYPENYISEMKNNIKRFGDKAILVPSFYNLNRGQIEPISLTMSKSIVPELNTQYEVFHAISSGTFVLMSSFIDIGYYDEKLFIDWVDFEWCWKARNKGYKIICIPKIQIKHNLGDNVKSVLGKKITLRSQFRYYYMIRNCLYLAKTSPYLNKKEKNSLKFRAIILIFGVLLVDDKRIKNFATVKNAVRDSKKMIKNYIGEYNE